METFTELDDKAWDLFESESTEQTMTKNKFFFVYHKFGYPFNTYYDRAKLELRKEKIKKLRYG
jgi:hypothetical protein